MSKDAKGDASVTDKIKKLLKIEQRRGQMERKELKITEEISNKLGPNSPKDTRILATREILEKLTQHHKLQKDGIGIIWNLLVDFFEPSKDIFDRTSIIKFYIKLLKISELDEQTRQTIFMHIKENFHVENQYNKLMFEFLCAVLNDGKTIEGIESKIQPFCMVWVPYMIKNYTPPTHVFNFLTNLVKHNSAYFNNDDFMGFLVVLGCQHVLQAASNEEIRNSFNFIETVISFSYIPVNETNLVIMTLCRLVSIPELTNVLWKVLKKYLCSGTANDIVDSMIKIVDANDDPVLVRGCLSLLTNAIWSKSSCADISVPYSSILKTLEKASLNADPLVVIETALGIKKMITNKKLEEYKSAWNDMMKVLTNLFFHAANINLGEAQDLHRVLKEVLVVLETVISNCHISENLTMYYDLPECHCCPRPVPYVLRLLDYKILALTPEERWIPVLVSLTNKYFLQESRPVVRLHMLKKLQLLFDKYKASHGNILCSELFNTQLFCVENDKDMFIRQNMVKFLIHIVLNLDTAPIIDKILQTIYQIVLHPYSNTLELASLRSNEADDVMEAVEGLILIFKKKIWLWPASHAMQAYDILMALLEMHYRNPIILQNHPNIRRKILEVIFEMRANKNYNLGFPNCDEACIPFQTVSKELDREIGRYSPYIIVHHKHGQKTKTVQLMPSSPDEPDSEEVSQAGEDEEKSKSGAEIEDKNIEKDSKNPDEDCDQENPPNEHLSDEEYEKPMEAARLSLTRAAHTVLVALKKENEWPIIQMILEKLPAVLENKALILSKDGNDIDYLATILCTLISETRSDFLKRFIKLPEKFSVSDFNAYIYPVIARLPSYHEDMGKVHQTDVIKVLENGILSKSSSICVSAMTTCVLEMRTTMVKHLRDVMLSLSKISATVQNAHPSLEFLSTLLHLPRVYSDFSPDQYMSVFAICIPYTNPFKFNHYIVSLAYHVIAMWFLKCRLPYRKQFVNFITKNLNTILVQESSDRSRHSGPDQQKKEEMVQFHRDLRETLVDFMARYCFDSYSPTTKRSPVAEMLVENGQKQMWLLGTRIITITTSGCGQRPMIKAMCDKCSKLCNPQGFTKEETVAGNPQWEDDGSRKRHQSDFLRSVSHEVTPSSTSITSPQTKDDLHMENKFQMGGRSPNIRSEIKQKICACWCRGWAEILIRQPTGDVSWMMRIQNDQTLVSEDDMLSLTELSNLFYSHEQLFLEEIFPSRRMGGAVSADSDLASDSGLTTARSNEWSESALSSGNNSQASSELKLNQDLDKPTDGNSAVSYSFSNPEVNLKLAEGELQSQQSSDKSLEHGVVDEQESSKRRIRSGGSSSIKRSSSIVGCPSPSPAPFSRIRHASAQMKSSVAAVPADGDDEVEDPSLQPMKRGRGHTISEMNPASRVTKKPIQRRPTLAHTGSLSTSVAGSSDSMFSLSAETSTATSDGRNSIKKPTIRGISPSAIFLQLYYQGNFGGGWMRPIFLPTNNTDIERSVRLFDLIKPQENHKIAVIYVGPNQRMEQEILRNSCGSGRYTKFLHGLGEIYEMKDLPENTYLGGYDRTGVDGDIVYMWNDQIMQVVFHVATVIPTNKNDEQCINKKRHIGNDYVTIIYNDSKYPYQLDTIKSNFNHSLVEIIPGDHKTNLVVTHCKQEVGDLFSWKPTNNARMVSDISLPVLVRQLAVHANLASMVSESLKDASRSPYSSNWLERLRRLRTLREKVIGTAEGQKQVLEQQIAQTEGTSQFLDFTDIIDVERPENKDRSRNRLFNRR